MAGKRLGLLAAAAGLAAAVALPAGDARADDCGSSTRVALPDCVYADYHHNRKGVAVRNDCWESVKVKVDRTGFAASDWTWVLDGNGGYKDNTGKYNIKNVKCCGSSSGGNCKQSVAGSKQAQCSDEFAETVAAGYCYDETITVNGNTCRIEARCRPTDNTSIYVTINLDYRDASEVMWCKHEILNDRLSLIDPPDDYGTITEPWRCY